jgi:indole-3-glycerol phosphate synthase
VKRASPSRGVIKADVESGGDGARLCRRGVNAVSVLTEERRFVRQLEHLTAVVGETPRDQRPSVMRKDFIVVSLSGL